MHLDLIDSDFYNLCFCDELGSLHLSSSWNDKRHSPLYCEVEKTTQVSRKDQLDFGACFYILA